MKNFQDLIRQKELHLQQLQKEIEALRLTLHLLTETEAAPEPRPFRPPVQTPAPPQRIRAGNYPLEPNSITGNRFP